MKKMRKRRWTAGILTAVMLVTLLGGCSGSGSGGATTAPTTAPAEKTTTAAAETTKAADETTAAPAPETSLASLRGNTSPSEEEIQLANNTFDDSYITDQYGLGSDYSAYPYQEDVTLDVWCPDFYGASTIWGTMNDHVIVKKIEELTGIHVNYIVPTIGEEKTEFNLMTGSGKLPDIIINVGKYYPGGLVGAVEDGLIVELTDYEDKLPNYMAFLNSNEERLKESVTDDKNLLCVYGHRTTPQGPVAGPRIKKIALEKTGWTTLPETIDEWHEFLTACKEAGFTIPLEFGSTSGFITSGYDFLATAYGISDGLFVRDGKVSYGPMLDGLTDYLTMMRTWYEEGLIDPDFLTSDSAHRTALAASDECASIVTNGSTMNSVNVEYESPLWPVLNKGDSPVVTFDSRWTLQDATAAITTQCKNVDAALAFLDFAFSKKGFELYDFGTYGDIHLVGEDGIPYYPEDSLLYTDPEIKELGGNYLTSKYRLHCFITAHDEYHAAPSVVPKIVKDTTDARVLQIGIRMPNVSLTVEETEKVAGIAANLETARDEYCTKIILGQLPIDAVAELQQKLTEFGVEEYVQVYQDAYDRFMQR